MIPDNVRDFYARKFGLPAEQIKLFEELEPDQVEDVRRLFSVGLISVDRYVYAVKRDGGLVWRRELRDRMVEKLAEQSR